MLLLIIYNTRLFIISLYDNTNLHNDEDDVDERFKKNTTTSLIRGKLASVGRHLKFVRSNSHLAVVDYNNNSNDS